MPSTPPETCAYSSRAALEALIHLGSSGQRREGIEIARFPADWNMHGRAAGPIRNQQMLDEGKPELVVSFLGGRGTGGYGQAREDGRN